MVEEKYYVDKIQATINGVVEVLVECPFSRHRVPEEGLSLSKKRLIENLIHYCGNPIIKEAEEIECRYGYTEIRVPEKCPLREESLTTTIEVLLKHEEANFG